ncbi:ribosomal protein L6, alpha-beta domain-containing protein [Polychytrium aggregatum]|uniref:ribosomal protein L6, alpha-beta domain-containing protein n=1 Tax=Polychytrium aggregatum TaxID=110093 RepID=UPI0022FE06D0|nr:ribosomal protein L6, alpha-beta domain-containing protein [Polychytrium aggregatum]KAI9202575.1 ribosomal protein L6, alpha-beta domain-containing protein [Polychytrium aggregatum]
MLWKSLLPSTRPAVSPLASSTIARGFSSSAPAASKIGRLPLKYPFEVSIKLEPYTPTAAFPRCTQQVVVAGPRGSLAMPVHPFVQLDFVDVPQDAPKKIIRVSVENTNDRKQKAMWGTTRALLNNMVEGVSEGFTIPIRFNGVGYRALFEEGKLSLKLGFSHPILLDIPKTIQVQIPAPQRIILQGNDLQEITQYAAKIRAWRPPEPYNQKGVFVGDETIKKKEGKKR